MGVDPWGLCKSLSPNWNEVFKGGVAAIGGVVALALAPETMGISTAIMVGIGGGSSIGWGISQIGVGLTGNELPFSNTTDALITATTNPGLTRDSLIAAHQIIDLTKGGAADTAVERALSITNSGLSIFDSSNKLMKSH